MSASIVTKSQERYNISWGLWTTHLTALGIDDPFLSSFDLQFKVMTVCEFAASLNHENMSADKIGKILGAMRFHFDLNYENSAEIFDHDSVTRARRGLRTRGRVVVKPKTLPWSVELITALRTSLWSDSGSNIDSRMTYIACVTAYNFSLRIGEYGYTGPKEDDHRFFLEDLTFEDDKGLTYNFVEWLANEMNVSIVLITFVKNSSKTLAMDLKEYYLPRGDGLQLQLFTDTLCWLKESKLKDLGHPVFSRIHDGRFKTLTSKMVNSSLKDLAGTFGLPRDQISSRSLKVGGSSNMAAAGLDGESIRRIVGHASVDSSLAYQRHTMNDGFAMSHGARVTIKDVKRLVRTRPLPPK